MTVAVIYQLTSKGQQRSLPRRLTVIYLALTASESILIYVGLTRYDIRPLACAGLFVLMLVCMCLSVAYVVTVRRPLVWFFVGAGFLTRQAGVIFLAVVLIDYQIGEHFTPFPPIGHIKYAVLDVNDSYTADLLKYDGFSGRDIILRSSTSLKQLEDLIDQDRGPHWWRFGEPIGGTMTIQAVSDSDTFIDINFNGEFMQRAPFGKSISVGRQDAYCALFGVRRCGEVILDLYGHCDAELSSCDSMEMEHSEPLSYKAALRRERLLSQDDAPASR